jgi:hypothetical protein
MDRRNQILLTNQMAQKTKESRERKTLQQSSPKLAHKRDHSFHHKPRIPSVQVSIPGLDTKGISPELLLN